MDGQEKLEKYNKYIKRQNKTDRQIIAWYAEIQPTHSNLQQRLQDVWDKYAARKITTAHFLKTIEKMYGINDQ